MLSVNNILDSGNASMSLNDILQKKIFFFIFSSLLFQYNNISNENASADNETQAKTERHEIKLKLQISTVYEVDAHKCTIENNNKKVLNAWVCQ